MWLHYYKFVLHCILSYSQVTQGLTAQIYRGTSDKNIDINVTNSKAECQEFPSKITSWHIFSWKKQWYFSWAEQSFRRNCMTNAVRILMQLMYICSRQVTPALSAHFTKKLPDKLTLLKWDSIFGQSHVSF